MCQRPLPASSRRSGPDPLRTLGETGILCWMKSIILTLALGSVALGGCSKPVTTSAKNFEECALSAPSRLATEAMATRRCHQLFERTATPAETLQILSDKGTFWRSPEVPSMGLGPKDSLKVAIGNPFEERVISEVLIKADFVRAASPLNREAGSGSDVLQVVWRADVSIRPGASQDVYLYFEDHIAPGTLADLEAASSKVIPLG